MFCLAPSPPARTQAAGRRPGCCTWLRREGEQGRAVPVPSDGSRAELCRRRHHYLPLPRLLPPRLSPSRLWRAPPRCLGRVSVTGTRSHTWRAGAAAQFLLMTQQPLSLERKSDCGHPAACSPGQRRPGFPLGCTREHRPVRNGAPAPTAARPRCYLGP